MSGDSQEPDGYDTLHCRGRSYILVPKYDTVQQLQEANIKADSILIELEKIAMKLGIDTTKRK